jgi:transcriptional regulator with XRE-family HTH domain
MSNLKTIRQSNNLSQSQLADKSGVNFRTIQNYEQGFKDINKAQAITLYNLAQALNVTIEDLLEI